MRFWQIIKSKFLEIIGDTRGEFRTSEADANEYVINGVRYIVSTRFSKTENKTMKEKLSEFIGGDFAHLTTKQYRDEFAETENLCTSKEQFTTAVRKFMKMETLTPALLNELIEKIEVYSIEGKGKNRTQRIIIHYRFFGVIENPVKEENVVLEARQGVAIEYLTA